jgi:hypothetical protein
LDGSDVTRDLRLPGTGIGTNLALAGFTANGVVSQGCLRARGFRYQYGTKFLAQFHGAKKRQLVLDMSREMERATRFELATLSS